MLEDEDGIFFLCRVCWTIRKANLPKTQPLPRSYRQNKRKRGHESIPLSYWR